VSIRLRKIVSITLALLLFLMVLASVPFGNAITWTGETQLTGQYQWDGFASGTQSNNGLIWVVWQTDRTGLPGTNYEIFYKTYNGISWSVDAPLFENASAQDIDPFFFKASNGTLYLFWASNWIVNPATGKTQYDLFYIYSNDNGQTWWPWDPRQLTSTFDDDYCPYVWQTQDGSIWVVWYRLLPGNYEVFYKKFSPQTNSWSADTQLTFDASPDKMPSIAQARNGTMLIFWHTYRLDNFDVYYVTSADNGVTWSAETRFTTSTDVDNDPALFKNIEGVLYVFWSVRPPTSTGYTDIYYATSYTNGVSWSAPVALVTDKYDDVYPGVFQSADRTIWVVFSSNRVGQPDGNLELFYKTTVPLPGDINGDWVVDAFDFALFGMAWGSLKGQPAYNPAADFNNDGRVDAWDLAVFVKYFGQSG